MPSQNDFAVRFGWGVNAVRAFGDCRVLVIVDVLSFSTSVDVAVSRGATVFPCRLGDDAAAAFATEHDATLAVDRTEVTADRPFSLSPRTMEGAGPGDRIVLPSPNGATLCVEATAGDAMIIVGCLRNAVAVAAAAGDSEPIGVVAAGERWPDGTLRPAIEDLLGAGAILRGLGGAASPEAALARDAYPGPTAAAALIQDSVSGRELADRGWGDDVRMAVAADVSRSVPVLVDAEIGAH